MYCTVTKLVQTESSLNKTRNMGPTRLFPRQSNIWILYPNPTQPEWGCLPYSSTYTLPRLIFIEFPSKCLVSLSDDWLWHDSFFHYHHMHKLICIFSKSDFPLTFPLKSHLEKLIFIKLKKASTQLHCCKVFVAKGLLCLHLGKRLAWFLTSTPRSVLTPNACNAMHLKMDYTHITSIKGV